MPSLRTIAMHYRISQLSRLFDVTPRALRFYEQIGLVNPSRDGQGRVYSRGDYQRVRLIAGGRKAGLSLDQVRELLDLYDPADGGEAQIVKAMEQLRQRIVDLEAQRDVAARNLAELSFGLERLRSDQPDDREGRIAPRPAADEFLRHAAS